MECDYLLSSHQNMFTKFQESLGVVAYFIQCQRFTFYTLQYLLQESPDSISLGQGGGSSLRLTELTTNLSELWIIVGSQQTSS